MLRYNTKLDLV